MFLVEAPLGRAHTITADGWQASSLTAPPAGFDSVVARGRYGPQSDTVIVRSLLTERFGATGMSNMARWATRQEGRFNTFV